MLIPQLLLFSPLLDFTSPLSKTGFLSESTGITPKLAHDIRSAIRPTRPQQINATVTNIAGDAAIQGSSLGNSFEADSNAPNMPIWNKQINNGDSGFDGQRQCLQYRRLDQPVVQRHRQHRPDHPLQHQLSHPSFTTGSWPRRHPWGKRECRREKGGLNALPSFLPFGAVRAIWRT